MRKKCIILPILFIFITITPFFANEKNAPLKGRTGEKIRMTGAKLMGPLKDVVNIYREHPKLTPQNLAKYFSEQPGTPASKRRAFRVHGTGGEKRLGDLSTAGKKRGHFILEALVLPRVQERWHNPPYDVIKCDIELYEDPVVLTNLNLKVRSVSSFGKGKILNVEVAGPDIEKIAAIPGVGRIAPVLGKKLNNDLGTHKTGASRIRLQSRGLYTKGYTGKGVIVGVIDTGIDWTHEDFIDPAGGGTRILYIWDTEIDTPGQTPADVFGGALSGLAYGTVWSRTQIDGGACTALDIDGHGTHVSGTAAGNGSATGKYTGMAPNADIIAVQGLDNNGILFTYEIASRLGKPCVVNMSYSPMFNFHLVSYFPELFPADGTGLPAKAIQGWNNTYGYGHIPVKAAGNDGHWNTYTDLTGGDFPYMTGGYHAGAALQTATTHTLEVPDYAALWDEWGWGTPSPWDFPLVSLGLWYESPVQVTLISPNGHVIGPMAHGTWGSAPTTGDGWCEYDFSWPMEPNGAYSGWIDLLFDVDPATEPVAGQWQVLVEPLGAGTGRFDMWCSDFDVFFFLVSPLDDTPHVKFLGGEAHANYIIDEGASPYEITVGSWVTRTHWQDIDGNGWTFVKQPWLKDIAESSSPGPSRDRRVKPDVAAPGSIIVSSASQTAPWPNDSLVDTAHGIKAGTSMAAPHVTGGIALMLEKNNRLNVAGVRNWITRWALNDTFTAARGQNAFGAGKFWVMPLNERPVALLTAGKNEIILDDPDRKVTFDGSASYDPEEFPLSYTFTLEAEPLSNSNSTAAGQAPLDYTFTVQGASAVLAPDPNREARYRANLVVNDTIVDSDIVYSNYLEAKFYPVYPPTVFTLQRLENNYIFFKEYINRLSWQANPENKTQIKQYKLYRKPKGAGDDSYQLIATLASDFFSYEERGLSKEDLYTYRLTAVNSRDKESDPVTVSNE